MILGMRSDRGSGHQDGDSYGFWLELRMLSVTLGTGKVLGKGFI